MRTQSHPSPSSRLRAALLAALSLAAAGAALSSPAPARAEEPATYELRYQGEFIDTDRKPLSGVFPLTFKLYDAPSGKKPLWQESHFIAVADGSYAINLGAQSSLPSSVAKQTVFLAVELEGKEMFRQKLSPKPIGISVSSSGMTGAVAGYCEECDACADAERLGGKLPEDFAPAALTTKLDKHIADPAAHGGPKKGGGGGLSKQTWASAPAGGSGGTPYSLTCPDGYVVTGLRGKGAALIDSIEVVCTKLE
jgi:hypothetical protein